MRLLLRSFILLSAGMLTACKGASWERLFFVEVEAQRFCKTQALVVPAVTPEMSGQASVTAPVQLPELPFPEDELELDLKLLSARLSAAAEHQARLDTVQQLTVGVTLKDENGQPIREVTVADFTREEGTLRSEVQHPENLAGLAGNDVDFHLTFRGSLPGEEWAVNFTPCAALKVRSNYATTLMRQLGFSSRTGP